MESYRVYSLVFGFFQSLFCLGDSSMLLCVVVVVLFNPVHIYHMNALIFILSILPLMANIGLFPFFDCLE